MKFLAVAISFFLFVFGMEVRHYSSGIVAEVLPGPGPEALSAIIGVPPGPKLDEIMRAISWYGVDSFRYLCQLEELEALRSLGLKQLHIKRWTDYKFSGNLYVMPPKGKTYFKTTLSFIIGVLPGPKLDEIINACFQNGYNSLQDLKYVGDEEEVRSLGFRTLHILRVNYYFETGNQYCRPKGKENFKTALSCIIGVLPGAKLDEIMNKLSQNGYNRLEDLKYVENEAELRSFGFRTLHIKRCKEFL